MDPAHWGKMTVLAPNMVPVRNAHMFSVTVFEEEGNCIVCLEMRADELMRRLISGELTIYSVVRTSPEPLHFHLQP
jgi:hypothetical protein